MGKANTASENGLSKERVEGIDMPIGTITILTDASWDSTKKTGTTFFCFDAEGELMHAHTGHTTCEDPFDAKAQAVLEALNYVK